MRLIDADALMKDVSKRYCEECEKRRGIKKGKQTIIYEIGDAPCRACSVDDMKFELETAPTIEPQRWIPVSERLPEEGQACLVADKGSITIDTYIGYGNPYNWRWYVRDYEAWQPLPEPYRNET